MKNQEVIYALRVIKDMPPKMFLISIFRVSKKTLDINVIFATKNTVAKVHLDTIKILFMKKISQ